jgi:hypothetical protein
MKDSQKRFTNPLEWWRVRQEEFPLLSNLARRVLSISATSVPSERVFSKSGWIMNKRRTCLGDTTFSNLVVVACSSSYLTQ